MRVLPRPVRNDLSGVSFQRKQRMQRNGRNRRNAMKATNGTDATTDEVLETPFKTEDLSARTEYRPFELKARKGEIFILLINFSTAKVPRYLWYRCSNGCGAIQSQNVYCSVKSLKIH